MLKLKLQYFGHLMQRADSLEKTLMMGKIEGRRRKGLERMRWLDGINELSKLKEMVKDRKAWCAAVHGWVMPPNHLILCQSLLLLPSIFPSIRVFSNESALHIRWSNYWSFSFSISLSSEYSGFTSFRIDWFDLLLSKGLSRVFSNTTVQKPQFFGTQLSL